MLPRRREWENPRLRVQRPASEFAGVSTPIKWRELELGIRPQDFTVRIEQICPELCSGLTVKVTTLNAVWSMLSETRRSPRNRFPI